MCMFLPMEVITIPERIKVVEVGSLIEIPSQLQVRQAISMLCKKQEEHPDKFSYIKFPFQSTLCPPKLTLWNVIYNHKVVTASDVFAHSGQVV